MKMEKINCRRAGVQKEYGGILDMFIMNACWTSKRRWQQALVFLNLEFRSTMKTDTMWIGFVSIEMVMLVRK